MKYQYVRNNYLRLKEEIAELAKEAGRESVTLVAVTKSGSDDELLALAECGVTDIGENRPQELKRRGELLLAAGFAPRLHEIGNLQKNKVRLIADVVHMIHSVDSLALGEVISRKATELCRTIPLLVEVNSGEEACKGGVRPCEVEELLLRLRELPSVEVVGLMTMGPVVSDPEELRPYFRRTKELFDILNEKYGFGNEPVLSMGMSDSYRVAIEEGSTLVRVGRRLFEK